MIRGGFTDAAGGFTIVEVMIVLAVSGILLISAIALINGRQEKTEFTTGINDELSQMQQIITDASNGFYPNNNDFTCTGVPGGDLVLTHVQPGSVKQGVNAGCIFLGSAVQFGLGSTPSGVSTLGVIPIVGNSYQVNQAPVYTVSESVPRALYPANNTARESTVPTDSVESDSIEDGLQIANGNKQCAQHGLGQTVPACYLSTKTGSWAVTGMAAFVAGDSDGNIDAPASASGANLASGTQQLSLYAIKGSGANEPYMTASNYLSNLTDNINYGLDSAEEVLVCIADYNGGGSQSGLFTIGGGASAGASNGGLGVTLQIKSDSTC